MLEGVPVSQESPTHGALPVRASLENVTHPKYAVREIRIQGEGLKIEKPQSVCRYKLGLLVLLRGGATQECGECKGYKIKLQQM
jgi:hypothetical protein